MPESPSRLAFSIELAQRAGELALGHFRSIESLTIESKGHQDMVSNADRDVETFVRKAIAEAYPADAIVGEEHAPTQGTSGHAWVIDPIDGTANFVRGIPAWCVVLACAFEGQTQIGVIHEPSTGETFSAERGKGAFLNGRPIRASASERLTEGSVGVGFSNRVEAGNVLPVIADIIRAGGVFFRNASGALMLAYVAAGRLLGYIEEHMNAWDCMAGLLLVEEAGGRIVVPDSRTVIAKGTLAVAAGANVFPKIEAIAKRRFSAAAAPDHAARTGG